MRRIVFVSRLDSDCSLGAFILCEIAPKLATKYDDLEIIIVGGGTEFSKIHKQSEQINRELNHKLILATGAVESPSDFFDKNTLFIGVSRASLEAMAHGLPVILLGNEGKLGLLDENNLELAKKTNFTCRGEGTNLNKNALKSFLFNEICRFYELSDAERLRLKILSKNVIKGGYSAQNMAQKTLNFYKKVITQHASSNLKIVICGYYGHKNLGDEAIFSVINKKLREIYPGADIHIINSKNPFKNALAMWHTDLFIFGGGSLLQNSTSNASLFYYLAIIHIAHAFAKRTIMLSNGIGPIENRYFSRNILSKIIAKSVDAFDFISVRDTDSQKSLAKMLPHRKIHLIRDPAFSFAPQISKTDKSNAKKECFVYIPCARGLNKSKISLVDLTKSLRKLEKSFEIPVAIVVLNPEEDLQVAKELSKHLENSKILCPGTPSELFSILKNVKFVISQRYHGTLFSYLCQIPTLSISNDPKMHAFCKDFELFRCQNTDILENPTLLSKQTQLSVDYYNAHKNRINNKIISCAQTSKMMINQALK